MVVHFGHIRDNLRWDCVQVRIFPKELVSAYMIDVGSMEVMPVRPTLDVRVVGVTEEPEERENIVCVVGGCMVCAGVCSGVGVEG